LKRGGEYKMNAATNLSSSVPVTSDTPSAVLSPKAKSNVNKMSNATDSKKGKNFSAILGKAQKQKSDTEQTQDTDKTDVKTLVDDTKEPSKGQGQDNLLAQQAVLMVNVASLPTMQILAEANLTDLTQPNEPGITSVNAKPTMDFSKLLQTSTAVSGVNLSSLEQLLPSNGEVQISNQNLMNMLNGKNVRSTLATDAGTKSQVGTNAVVNRTIQTDQQVLFSMLNGKINATALLDQKQALLELPTNPASSVLPAVSATAGLLASSVLSAKTETIGQQQVLPAVSATADLLASSVLSAKTETIGQQQVLPAVSATANLPVNPVLSAKTEADISFIGNPQNGQLVPTMVDETQKTTGQVILNAVTGKMDGSTIPIVNTALMETVSKAASGKADKKADVPAAVGNADKTTILTKASLDSVNPVHVVADDTVQPKQNVPMAISTLEKPVEKVSLMVNESANGKQPVPANPKTKTSTTFGQLMLNSLNTTTVSTGSTVNATTENQPLAKYDIPGQIVEQARLIKTTEDTQMVIKLSPEHLGDLTLKVSVANGGAVTASFHSDNAQVRTILENSLIQLKQELEAKGMKVDNVEVYAGLGDFMSNGQNNQTNSQQQNTHFKNQKIDLADFEEEASKINLTTGNITEDSVDYRI